MDEPGYGSENLLQPEWLAPPADMLPGIAPVAMIIGRSDEAVVMLTGALAFPSGVAMALRVQTRASFNGFDADLFDAESQRAHDAQHGLGLRFEFADGREATNRDPLPAPQEVRSDRPVLMARGGSAGQCGAERRYWLTPLPSGTLKVVCRSPRLGIGPTISHIDGDQIGAAAILAQSIWTA